MLSLRPASTFALATQSQAVVSLEAKQGVLLQNAGQNQQKERSGG
jgi:hypothetical protein